MAEKEKEGNYPPDYIYIFNYYPPRGIISRHNFKIASDCAGENLGFVLAFPAGACEIFGGRVCWRKWQASLVVCTRTIEFDFIFLKFTPVTVSRTVFTVKTS